jgi:hypothetical protein
MKIDNELSRAPYWRLESSDSTPRRNPDNYIFLGFKESNTKNKKYDAILRNKITNKLKFIPFGDINYQQYKDKALGLYSDLDHLDKKRKDNYKSRHNKDINNKFSSGWFSYKYLWSD